MSQPVSDNPCHIYTSTRGGDTPLPPKANHPSLVRAKQGNQHLDECGLGDLEAHLINRIQAMENPNLIKGLC